MLFAVLALSGVLGKVVNSIPGSLKSGIAAGIGLFITLIGLEYGNLIVSLPGPLVRLGDFHHPVTLVSVLGLLVMIVLLGYGIRGAILMGIVLTALVAAAFRLIPFRGVFSANLDIAATFWRFDLRGLLSTYPARLASALFVLFYLALFDTVGTLVDVGQQAGLLRGGQLLRAGRALFSDAIGTTVGAAFGSSTHHLLHGIGSECFRPGAHRLCYLVTGALFFAATFFSPLASMIGAGVAVGTNTGGTPVVRYPTLAPALLVVGAMMWCENLSGTIPLSTPRVLNHRRDPTDRSA